MAVDSLEFRRALGAFATGVTVITTVAPDGGLIGVTANSFNSVSLDPPMVLWSIARTSGSMAAFLEASHFAVHILASDQEYLSNRFAQRGIEKFDAIETVPGVGGIPLIEHCSARFECRTAYHYEGGDHVIIVGEVLSHEHRDAKPLLFHGGRYARLMVPGGEGAAPEPDIAHLIRRAYFLLLGPVRTERVRRGISLEEHYILEILLAGPRSLSDVPDLISYTGLQVTTRQVEELVVRGLILFEAEGAAVQLSDAGRNSVIGLRAAAQAIEAEVALHMEEGDLAQLKALLRQVSPLLQQQDEPSSHHMHLLDQVLFA